MYHDPGTEFSSEEFRNLSTTLGITVDEVQTEAHHSIGGIERKHAILRAVYDRASLDEPSSSREEKLLLALRCENDALGPEGISPTMLVFEVIPNLYLSNKRDLSLQARIRTIRECTLLARRLKAQHVRDEAARRRHVPNIRNIRTLEATVPGDTVLVYREMDGWKPYPFVSMHEDSVSVQLPKRISRFAITSCKPAANAPVTSAGELVPITHNAPVSPPELQNDAVVIFDGDVGAEHREEPSQEGADGDSLLHEFLLDTPISGYSAAKVIPHDFALSRRAEMQGLHEHGTFTIVPEEDSYGLRLYKYKYVNKIKPNGDLRSRFCVQAFNDRNHGPLTLAPTIQRQSMRLMISIGAGRTVATRDAIAATPLPLYYGRPARNSCLHRCLTCIERRPVVGAGGGLHAQRKNERKGQHFTLC